MKNILFATTALVATAGIASADVTTSGLANVGIASANGADYSAYSEVELDVALSAATDSGLTLTASVDINAGQGFDMGDDEFDNNGGTAGLGAVSVAGAFGTLTFDNDGVADLYDGDSDDHDVKFAYSAGDLSLGLTYDVDTAAATVSGISASVGYTMGSTVLSVSGNDGDNGDGGMQASVAYTVSDALSVTVTHKDAATADAVQTLGVSYAAGDVTLTGDTDSDNGWNAGVAYTSGATAFSVSTDEASEWSATGSYDLGGASIVAGFKHTDSAYLGLAMAF